MSDFIVFLVCRRRDPVLRELILERAMDLRRRSGAARKAQGHRPWKRRSCGPEPEPLIIIEENPREDAAPASLIGARPFPAALARGGITFLSSQPLSITGRRPYPERLPMSKKPIIENPPSPPTSRRWAFCTKHDDYFGERRPRRSSAIGHPLRTACPEAYEVKRQMVVCPPAGDPAALRPAGRFEKTRRG